MSGASDDCSIGRLSLRTYRGEPSVSAASFTSRIRLSMATCKQENQFLPSQGEGEGPGKDGVPPSPPPPPQEWGKEPDALEYSVFEGGIHIGDGYDAGEPMSLRGDVVSVSSAHAGLSVGIVALHPWYAGCTGHLPRGNGIETRRLAANAEIASRLWKQCSSGGHSFARRRELQHLLEARRRRGSALLRSSR